MGRQKAQLQVVVTMRVHVPEDDAGGSEQDCNRQAGVSRLEWTITLLPRSGAVPPNGSDSELTRLVAALLADPTDGKGGC